MKKFSENLGKWVGHFGFWALSALFIWWGWNVLAPHLNAPTFGYWEIFGIRMMFSNIVYIVKKSVDKE